MKRNVRGVGVGTVSLVMIFAVLCLTVFSMLTLSTANAEKIMSDKTAAFVSGYYEADSLATKIRAQIISSEVRGLIPNQIEGIPIQSENVDGVTVVSYICPVNDVQELFVSFRIDRGENKILHWATRSSEDWTYDPSIDVWDGSEEGMQLFDMNE